MRVVIEDACLTYPHCNGFVTNREAIVCRLPFDGRVRLAQVDETGHSVALGEIASSRHLYFDVARNGQVISGVVDGEVFAALVSGGLSRRRIVARQLAGETILPICSMNHDGSRVVVSFRRDVGGAGVAEIDVESGRRRVLVEKPWSIGHAHYCPFDENWIGFCHEGPGGASDRLWAWHERHAPAGKVLADQSGKPVAQRMELGHERWCWHDAALVAVAYASGASSGLWQMFADGRPSRRLHASSCGWHCDISRDGKFAVIDTLRNGVCEIQLIDLRDGHRTTLATTGAGDHPFHPHPVFSPDGKAVWFNHTTWTAGRPRMGVAVVHVPVAASAFRRTKAARPVAAGGLACPA